MNQIQIEKKINIYNRQAKPDGQKAETEVRTTDCAQFGISIYIYLPCRLKIQIGFNTRYIYTVFTATITKRLWHTFIPYMEDKLCQHATYLCCHAA